jgi:hypothetical protein
MQLISIRKRIIIILILTRTYVDLLLWRAHNWSRWWGRTLAFRTRALLANLKAGEFVRSFVLFALFGYNYSGLTWEMRGK